jgi:hypothetical protein
MSVVVKILWSVAILIGVWGVTVAVSNFVSRGRVEVAGGRQAARPTTLEQGPLGADDAWRFASLQRPVGASEPTAPRPSSPSPVERRLPVLLATLTNSRAGGAAWISPPGNPPDGPPRLLWTGDQFLGARIQEIGNGYVILWMDQRSVRIDKPPQRLGASR